MADRFTVFRSVYDALMACPADDAQKAFGMIGRYAMDGVLPDPEKSNSYGLFLSVRPLIDTSVKKTEAGRHGGEANRKQTGSKLEANQKQTGSKPEAKIKEERRNIKETLSKESAKKSGFKPPTPQEVADYVKEKGYQIDAEKFCDFYESKGWYVGKNKMKDWKAAVRTWARSQREEMTAKGSRQEKTARPSAGRFANFEQREYDFDELEAALLQRGMT